MNICFIKSVGIGDKAIGETLESTLGIKPNASKRPDYKGIELKASRSSKNRSNLFSKTPLLTITVLWCDAMAPNWLPFGRDSK